MPTRLRRRLATAAVAAVLVSAPVQAAPGSNGQSNQRWTRV
jgi:hypothetical protein